MKKLTIRISDDLHDRLAALAQGDHRSINKQVIALIEAAVRGQRSQDRSQQNEGKKEAGPV